jgi:hypothetical protein
MAAVGTVAATVAVADAAGEGAATAVDAVMVADMAAAGVIRAAMAVADPATGTAVAADAAAAS